MMRKKNGTRVALVTGAARGLGQGFAVRLAGDGHRVIALDRLDCSETLAAIEAQGGRGAQVLADLSDANAVAQAAENILEEHGPVDILVNNAGIIPNVEFERIDLGAWRSLMAINLEAPFLLCRGLIPSMKKRGYGRIVNIASN